MHGRTIEYPMATFSEQRRSAKDEDDFQAKMTKLICYFVDGDAWHFAVNEQERESASQPGRIIIQANQGLHFHDNGTLVEDSPTCMCRNCLLPQDHDPANHYHVVYQLSLGPPVDHVLPRAYSDHIQADEAARLYSQEENFIAVAKYLHCTGVDPCPTRNSGATT